MWLLRVNKLTTGNTWLRAYPGGAVPQMAAGLHSTQERPEAPAPGHTAAGPVHPQTWLCVCCSVAVPALVQDNFAE